MHLLIGRVEGVSSYGTSSGSSCGTSYGSSYGSSYGTSNGSHDCYSQFLLTFVACCSQISAHIYCSTIFAHVYCLLLNDFCSRLFLTIVPMGLPMDLPIDLPVVLHMDLPALNIVYL